MPFSSRTKRWVTLLWRQLPTDRDRSGSTFSPPAIRGCYGRKPLRASLPYQRARQRERVLQPRRPDAAQRSKKQTACSAFAAHQIGLHPRPSSVLNREERPPSSLRELNELITQKRYCSRSEEE